MLGGAQGCGGCESRRMYIQRDLSIDVCIYKETYQRDLPAHSHTNPSRQEDLADDAKHLQQKQTSLCEKRPIYSQCNMRRSLYEKR